MARDLRVNIDRRAVERLARDRAVLEFTHQVAEAAAEDIEARAPSIVKGSTSRFYAKREDDGSTVAVKSSFWHFPEYGHSRYPPNPYIRPSVQRILTRVRGRFRAQ